MSSEGKKRLGIFFRLASPRFFGALGKDTSEFLIAFRDRLHNLGLGKTDGAD